MDEHDEELAAIMRTTKKLEPGIAHPGVAHAESVEQLEVVRQRDGKLEEVTDPSRENDSLVGRARSIEPRRDS